MRRLAAIALLAGAVVALLVTGVAAGGHDSGGDYRVRAIFDSAGFVVPGEQVRIAGATVGSVADIDVTGEDDPVHEDGSPQPGKAIVVLQIDEPGFQDFRMDASCLIRPQSLLGEKYVECQPTQPRATGSPAPPELEQTDDGERFLPLENNGKAVDIDLVNNIMREPVAQRFRLILNDLGAGLAARGEELREIVERSNPALQQTDRVLAILARQKRLLAELAEDGHRILGPLAREREHLSGFINNAVIPAQATAERSADLEAGLQRLPRFFQQLRLTMDELTRFSDQATPTLAALSDAAPAITRATVALGPFANASTASFQSLGKAAARSGPDLVASDPLIRKTQRLGEATKPTAKNLRRLLGSLRKSGGEERLMQLFWNGTGALNGFDQYGHFLRALLIISSCTFYETAPVPGCNANFADAFSRKQMKKGQSLQPLLRRAQRALEAAVATDAQGDPAQTGLGPIASPRGGAGSTGENPPSRPLEPAGGTPDQGEPAPDAPTLEEAGGLRMREAKQLMDFFLGETQ